MHTNHIDIKFRGVFMERKDKVVLTNMCMVYSGSKVLVENKVTKDRTGIIFPGGHIERNEAIVDSVIREVYEETGLTISSPELCGIKDWLYEDGSRYIVFLFKTNQYTGALKPSYEGDVFWVELSELQHMPTMWHMDSMIHIFTGKQYSELFLDSNDNRKPILM